MRLATLTRKPSTDDGTFGALLTDTSDVFYSLELPWRDNAPQFSCIPTGKYILKWIDSPKHGMCYQVTNVPERSMVEVHSANFAGDAKLGKFSQLLGCIALGKSTGVLATPSGISQQAVLSSKTAIAEFDAIYNTEDIELVIQ